VEEDRDRESLSIADEFNGVAFRCIPVELAARGPSKSIRENLFGAVRPAAPLRRFHPSRIARSPVLLVRLARFSKSAFSRPTRPPDDTGG